jgi:hypothetical protein
VVARESTFREIGAIRSDVMGFRNIWGIGDWGRSDYGFTAGGVLIEGFDAHDLGPASRW